jgi:tetratricopeptide (TPR) repeat protein
MVGRRYNRAYEAYQQAVYRDGRNPEYWRNIGQLYFKLNQYLDALDAYSRSIRLNPYFSEVWASLGELYYNSDQANLIDSLKSYSRALELDPTNQVTRARVRQLKIRLQVRHVPLEDLDITGVEQGGKIDEEISDDISSSYRR